MSMFDERLPDPTTGPWRRAGGLWVHGTGLHAAASTSAPARRAGLSAAEIEIKRLQAAAGQPRQGEDLVQMLQRQHRERQAAAAAGSPPTVAPPPPAPAPVPSDAAGTRAQRHALNEWSRAQAIAASAKMREQRGGWGR